MDAKTRNLILDNIEKQMRLGRLLAPARERYEQMGKEIAEASKQLEFLANSLETVNALIDEDLATILETEEWKAETQKIADKIDAEGSTVQHDGNRKVGRPPSLPRLVDEPAEVIEPEVLESPVTHEDPDPTLEPQPPISRKREAPVPVVKDAPGPIVVQP